ncbi:toxic anion resistance protein [Thalassolituus sp.]|jgi:uncharacterized protein YaaN involved in tellurite resistance|uniref:toxic anion resistance protein n=1 Tax=Thalassolituus sp. TaxID=2030822 RepID=UPI0032D96493
MTDSQTPVKAPKWASEEQLGTLTDKAKSLIVATKEKSGPALNRVIDTLGLQSQKSMAAANDIMEQSISSLLKDVDGDSPTANKLLKLRSTMDELNPHSLSNTWWFNWVPTGIKRKAVTRFIRRYEPMRNHLTAIFDGLRNGKDQLIESNIILENQYNSVMDAKRDIESEVYIGELFLVQVDQLEADVDQSDLVEVQKLATIKNKAARRIRELRTKEQAAMQFFISINQTIENNSLLGEQIESALSVGPMVLTNALRIQAALSQQKAIKDAVNEFQTGLGDLMTQNAKAVNQATQEIGDLYNNPVISLQKLEEGFDQLMQAVNNANETMRISTDKARESSSRLAEMTAELAPVVEGTEQARNLNTSISITEDDMTLKLDTPENKSGGPSV